MSLTKVNYQMMNPDLPASGNYNVGTDSLEANTSTNYNLAIGNEALSKFTTKSPLEPWAGNFAIGRQSLENLVEGSHNIAIGVDASQQQVFGDQNVAIGTYALASNVYGQAHTAVGVNCLALSNSYTVTGTLTSGSNVITGITPNTSGINPGNFVYGPGMTPSISYVTAVNSSSQVTINTNATVSGAQSLQFTANANTAVGSACLYSNTTGQNDAFGSVTMLLNTTGTRNAAFGAGALHDNVTGDDNTAVGVGDPSIASPLYYTTGSGNTGLGSSAGAFIGSGNNNTAIGKEALNSPGAPTYLYNTDNNTAIGYRAGTNYSAIITNASNCTFIGAKSTASTGGLSNSTAIGHEASIRASNQVVLGNNAITIYTLAGGLPTYADNAAALTGGLLANDLYKTATGTVQIVY